MVFRTYWVWSILLGVSVPLFAHLPKDQVIDSYFSAYDRPNIPGAAVLVMKQGKVLYSHGYGAAELTHFEPVSEKTNFRLASLTKQFTATAVLQLVHRGLLSFDTSLCTLIPEFPAYGSQITIRHLLSHTSGLLDYESLIPSNSNHQLTDDDVLDMLTKEDGLYFNPGSQYRYSNGGYVLLGLIVERVTGQNIASFLYHNIFNPLKMNDTIMYEGPTTEIKSRAYGYSPSGNGFKKTDQDITSATRGDGGVYSSVHDWEKWETAINENLILPKDLQDLAFSPGKLNNGSSIPYGFGWMLDHFKGLIHQYHTGSSIGFRTAIERFPEKSLAVLVLVNRANSTPWIIARNIAERFF